MRTIIAIVLMAASPLLAPPLSLAQSPTPKIPADSPVYGVYPIAYREIVTTFVNSRLIDPASARIEFTEPQAGTLTTKEGRASGYVVRITVNSRNKFGTYTGKQKYRFLLRNGEIIYSDRG